MAVDNSPSPELATAQVGHPWDGTKKVIILFDEHFSITEFLLCFDKLRLDSNEPPEGQIFVKASRLFYTFSGLHFLLKQVSSVAIYGLDSSTDIEIGELRRHFESCSDYFTELTKLLKVVELHFLELISSGETSSARDYVEALVEYEQITALEQRVREDHLVIPYLLTVLESEGLNISVSMIQRMLCIY